MSDDPRVLRLLEEMLESGQSPEEACADSPELLVQVREHLKRCRRLEAQLDAFFPPSSASASSSGSRRQHRRGQAGLPDIPGYQLQDVLGRGGMGVVYKARQLALNRLVALKMLLSGVYASPAELSRFIHEAKAIAGLQHDHIVQVYDIGELDGCPYFTMELMGGGNLGQKLHGMPQPAREAAILLSKLVAAIAAAHEAGIVHRDMKPANVLLSTDGTPKIADFGLAQQVEAAAGMTLSGARLGTPSYMAPEQAMGHPGRIGPPADIYALGAILYEMLTGRPPFRAESTAETERQLLTEEPVAPSRLNARVPRDLETICLKCLHKDPQRRYATAAALGDDLARYLDGEPIAARRTGLLGRCLRWARRRPAHATAIVATLLVAGVLAGAAVWVTMLRADQRNAVESDLRDVMQFQSQARWTSAQAALNHAETRLGPHGPADLQAQLGRIRHDLQLVMRLDQIRLTRATRGEPQIYQSEASRAYDQTLRDSGLIQSGDAPKQIAARVRESAVRLALLDALEDWIACTPDKQQRAWVIDIARSSESDPLGWPARILDSAAWDNRAVVDQLIADVPVEHERLSLLLVLAERLKAAGGDPSAFVRRVQSEHPANFWANLRVGNDVLFRTPKVGETFEAFPKEAIGYYRAALASRPDAAVGYCVVGDALRFGKDPQAALRYYQKALEQDPHYARAYTNIGLTLENEGHLDLAIENYRKAIPLDPNYAWTYFELANALRDKGQLAEAEACYRKAMAIDPTITKAAAGLQSVLIRQRRAGEVLASYKSSLEADPQHLDEWITYAELCLFTGDRSEYDRARGEMLDRFANSTDPAVCERTSRACLLEPLSGEALQKAVAMAHRAEAAEATVDPHQYPYFLLAEGLAEYRADRFAQVISVLKGRALAAGTGPRLILAMAQFRQGDAAAAKASLADAMARFDWSRDQADWPDAWIWHVLRREAEAMVLPRLGDFLTGSYWPSDNNERLGLTGICQFEGLNARVARLYAEALEEDPSLSESTGVDYEFCAARFAALAGCGIGQDAGQTSQADRLRWRSAARAWLAADLSECQKQLAAGTAKRHAALERLSKWISSRELSCLREPSAIAELPSAERADWMELWREVHELLDRANDRQ